MVNIDLIAEGYEDGPNFFAGKKKRKKRILIKPEENKEAISESKITEHIAKLNAYAETLPEKKKVEKKQKYFDWVNSMINLPKGELKINDKEILTKSNAYLPDDKTNLEPMFTCKCIHIPSSIVLTHIEPQEGITTADAIRKVKSKVDEHIKLWKQTSVEFRNKYGIY